MEVSSDQSSHRWTYLAIDQVPDEELSDYGRTAEVEARDAPASQRAARYHPALLLLSIAGLGTFAMVAFSAHSHKREEVLIKPSALLSEQAETSDCSEEPKLVHSLSGMPGNMLDYSTLTGAGKTTLQECDILCGKLDRTFFLYGTVGRGQQRTCVCAQKGVKHPHPHSNKLWNIYKSSNCPEAPEPKSIEHDGRHHSDDRSSGNQAPEPKDAKGNGRQSAGKVASRDVTTRTATTTATYPPDPCKAPFEAARTKLNSCEQQVMSSSPQIIANICHCTAAFTKALTSCAGNKSAYGTAIDDFPPTVQRLYGISCKICEDKDYECRCAKGYMPAVSRYTHCNARTVGDKGHFCSCLKAFISDLHVCTMIADGSPLKERLAINQGRYHESCLGWAPAGILNCGIGWQKIGAEKRNVHCRSMDFNADPHATEPVARIGCCQEINKENEELKPNCATLYSSEMNQYNTCIIAAEKAGHSKCDCIFALLSGLKPCMEDPAWSFTAEKTFQQLKKELWMPACHVATCDAYVCSGGRTKKESAYGIRCKGAACDASDQTTCCTSVPAAKAKCTSMDCPEGYRLKPDAASLECEASHCSIAADSGTCCEKPICPGAVALDFGDKQDECSKIAGPMVSNAAKSCYTKTDCAEMIKCYASKVCFDSDMIDSCQVKLSVCGIKPSGFSSSQWNIKKRFCDSSKNPAASNAVTCADLR